MDALQFFPGFPEIDSETDKNKNQETGTDTKEKAAEGFELIAVKEGLARQQDFEVSIVSGAEFFTAWQVIANFVERDVQIIRVID